MPTLGLPGALGSSAAVRLCCRALLDLAGEQAGGSQGGEQVHGENAFQKAALASKVTKKAGTSGVARQFHFWIVLWGPEKREQGLLCLRAPSLTQEGEVHQSKQPLVPSTSLTQHQLITALLTLDLPHLQQWGSRPREKRTPGPPPPLHYRRELSQLQQQWK